MQMNEAINLFLTTYGTHELAADALGYSDRQYRNIRQKVMKGESLPPRITALIDLKLREIQRGCETAGAYGVDCVRR